MIRLFLTLFLAVSAPVTARALTIEGPARVVDGDTLDIAGQKVRLLDVDAFETAQTCNGQPCGQQATTFVQSLVRDRDVTCRGDETDKYHRLLAHCYVGSTDVGGSVVINGLGVAYRAYSTAYVALEQAARDAKRGVWAKGTPQMPWDYRAGRWTVEAAAAPTTGCPIKGNISSSGERIYHTPYSRSYAKTRISPKKGERWFCSEAEALAAGWRAPLQ